ncbi:hypothetical protein NP233_g9989 [Leucocoprinus birnbaumii]|uniref:Uncharacterized protein n=1 Tax=Leucocoprinus birnbaumii TaxID=56174 RepID=A0AAD5VK55_9AGAR|nr:hypothetical protein NP233_g9989 [Leucocoprinus birnbaumii]
MFSSYTVAHVLVSSILDVLATIGSLHPFPRVSFRDEEHLIGSPWLSEEFRESMNRGAKNSVSILEVELKSIMQTLFEKWSLGKQDIHEETQGAKWLNGDSLKPAGSMARQRRKDDSTRTRNGDVKAHRPPSRAGRHEKFAVQDQIGRFL